MSEPVAPPPRPTCGRACYLGDSAVKASEGLVSCGEPGTGGGVWGTTRNGDGADDRGLKAGRGQGWGAGTCGGVFGTGTFFSTKLTPAGSRSSSLTTFLWGQPTWTGQGAGGRAGTLG